MNTAVAGDALTHSAGQLASPMPVARGVARVSYVITRSITYRRGSWYRCDK
jgi:hypothetical protein